LIKQIDVESALSS